MTAHVASASLPCTGGGIFSADSVGQASGLTTETVAYVNMVPAYVCVLVCSSTSAATLSGWTAHKYLHALSLLGSAAVIRGSQVILARGHLPLGIDDIELQQISWLCAESGL